MLELTDGRDAIHRDITRCIRTLEDLDAGGEDTATRLTGWSVRDLTAHLVFGQRLQADAWEGLRAGTEGPPSVDAPLPTQMHDLLPALRDQHARFHAHLGAIGEEQLGQPCHLPYGSPPAVVALQIAVMEAGVHRSDLADAVGHEDGEHLDPDTLDATFTILPGSLPQLAVAATERPSPGTSLRLAPDGLPPVSLRFTDPGWDATGAGDEVDCTIQGSPSAVALFALGRVPLSHAALTVHGDARLANDFKRHFPGP